MFLDVNAVYQLVKPTIVVIVKDYHNTIFQVVILISGSSTMKVVLGYLLCLLTVFVYYLITILT